MSFFKTFFKPKKKKEYIKLIFTLYYQKAFDIAYYYSGDPYISEEAAQEAIYKAISYIDQLRDPDKIEAWIKKIAKNNTLSLLKKRQKIVSIESSAIIADSLENSPEYIHDSKEIRNEIMSAINDLDPLSKQVIHLRFYEELKVKDIAAIMDKPEGTIKTLIYRAKNTIKRVLKEKGYIELTNTRGKKKIE